jgi:hypothetical protein
MKTITLLTLAVLLSGCGKFKDTFATSVDGYTLRCIEGTKYVLMTSERGLAVTPLVGTNGMPKGCP